MIEDGIVFQLAVLINGSKIVGRLSGWLFIKRKSLGRKPTRSTITLRLLESVKSIAGNFSLTNPVMRKVSGVIINFFLTA